MLIKPIKKESEDLGDIKYAINNLGAMIAAQNAQNQRLFESVLNERSPQVKRKGKNNAAEKLYDSDDELGK